ncbi:MAG: hypothetical protein ACHREM_09485 [Polyangiales bacterium]
MTAEGSESAPADKGSDGHDTFTRAEVERHIESVLAAKLGHEALLRAEVRREIEKTLTAKPTLHSWLNSPFLITFLGGILVTVATQTYARGEHAEDRRRAETQHERDLKAVKDRHDEDQTAARSRRDDDRARVVLERKMNTLATFTNDFETSNSILITLQSKAFFLQAHPKGDHATDLLGLSRDQVEAEHWEVWKLYTQTKKVEAEVTEVKLLFDCPDVKSQADVVSKAIGREYDAKTVDALMKADREANAAQDFLSAAMSDELHHECPNAPSASVPRTVTSTPSGVGTNTPPVAPPTVVDGGR